MALNIGSPQHITVEMVKELVKKKGNKVKKILDIGCGDGSVLYLLKQKNLVEEAIGVEIDNKLVLETKGKGITTFKVDINSEEIPLLDGHIDVVLSIDVVEHILNLNNFFLEIRRILKPNGFLIISTPNVQFIYHIFKLILGYGPKTSFGSGDYHGSELYDGGHVHYFTVKDLCVLLKKYGFEVCEIRGTYNINKKFINKFMKILSNNLFFLRYFCPGIVIKASRRE